MQMSQMETAQPEAIVAISSSSGRLGIAPLAEASTTPEVCKVVHCHQSAHVTVQVAQLAGIPEGAVDRAVKAGSILEEKLRVSLLPKTRSLRHANTALPLTKFA